MAHKATRFDSMVFPEYEFREYPKMISVPRKLPADMPDASNLDDGCKRFDSNGYHIATVKDGAWVAVPQQIQAESEEDEARIIARAERGKPAPADTERDDLMRDCVTRGIQFDKRWGVEKLRKALEEAQAA